MAYTCSVCNEKVEGDLIVFTEHTQDHIVELIKEKFPDWVEENGICQKCLNYFQSQLKGDT